MYSSSIISYNLSQFYAKTVQTRLGRVSHRLLDSITRAPTTSEYFSALWNTNDLKGSDKLVISLNK